MNLKVVDISLDLWTTLESGLKRIFGIGIEKARYIMSLFGLGAGFRTKYSNRYVEEYLNVIIMINFTVNLRLESLLQQEFSNKKTIRLKSALRLERGLPSRGQGTHGNSKQNRHYLAYKWQQLAETF